MNKQYSQKYVFETIYIRTSPELSLLKGITHIKPYNHG